MKYFSVEMPTCSVSLHSDNGNYGRSALYILDYIGPLLLWFMSTTTIASFNMSRRGNKNRNKTGDLANSRKSRKRNTHNYSTGYTVSHSEKKMESSEQHSKESPRSGWKFFVSGWGMFWSFLGPLSALIGVWTFFDPNVSFSTGVNLDPKEQFQTQFVVTETGYLGVRDITFSCSLIGKSAEIQALSTEGHQNLQPIKYLKGAASRGCFSQSLVEGGPMLKVTAYYTWPLIGYRDSTSAYFSVRTGPAGSFLVLDVKPNPEPPTLFTIRAK